MLSGAVLGSVSSLCRLGDTLGDVGSRATSALGIVWLIHYRVKCFELLKKIRCNRSDATAPISHLKIHHTTAQNSVQLICPPSAYARPCALLGPPMIVDPTRSDALPTPRQSSSLLSHFPCATCLIAPVQHMYFRRLSAVHIPQSVPARAHCTTQL